jgi:uncharacterized membrane protein YuzA (DUF378 family)
MNAWQLMVAPVTGNGGYWANVFFLLLCFSAVYKIAHEGTNTPEGYLPQLNY